MIISNKVITFLKKKVKEVVRKIFSLREEQEISIKEIWSILIHTKEVRWGLYIWFSVWLAGLIQGGNIGNAALFAIGITLAISIIMEKKDEEYGSGFVWVDIIKTLTIPICLTILFSIIGLFM